MVFNQIDLHNMSVRDDSEAEDEAAYKKIIDVVLKNDYLDQWIDTIYEKKGNVHMFFNKRD